MKRIILHIGQCWHCLHITSMLEEDGKVVQHCMLPGKEPRAVPDPDHIPEWCELEEDPDPPKGGE